MNKTISIIIPIYNESRDIRELYARLLAVINNLSQYSWNFVCINDGSIDDSYQILKNLAEQDCRITLIDFSRNFGKEVALTAGVHEAKSSDAVICIDADLQHPPELIVKLLEQWENGFEVVGTIRTHSENEPTLRRICSTLYYWIMGKISGVEIVPKTTDFRLYDRKVVQAFSVFTERGRMFRGVMDWLGFKRTFIPFKASSRKNGDPGYSYQKLWQLAVTSITAFSLWPLKITGYLGTLITLISGSLLCWMLANYAFNGHWVYTPLAMVVVANTFLIGIVLMGIGLVALYIGSIHTEVINRPLYVVRERISNN